MDKLSNLELHIKNMSERIVQMEEKLLIDEKLTPDDIVAMRLKQTEYQNSLQWLINVKNLQFPPKIITPNSNGIHHN
jgi:hypothetical protein